MKRKIGNKARVEGSICNAYLTEEIANFCSYYLKQDVDSKTRDLGRNVNADVEVNSYDNDLPEMFTVDIGKPSKQGKTEYLDKKSRDGAHLFVLSNSGILEAYER